MTLKLGNSTPPTRIMALDFCQGLLYHTQCVVVFSQVPCQNLLTSPLQQQLVEDEVSSTLPRFQRTNRQLPLWCLDVFPEHLSPLPSPEIFPCPPMAGKAGISHSSSLSHNTLSVTVGKSTRSLYSLFHKMFKTENNKFSLFRIYDTDIPPRHDPEDPYSVENTCSSLADWESSSIGSSNQPLPRICIILTRTRA
jgi:hypothetical protein